MQARLVRVLDAASDPDLLSSWGSLHERALEQNPFFEPQCVIPAARYLPAGEAIELLVAEEGGTVHGCMPLVALPRWHWSRRGTLTTNVRRLTWLGTPLLDGDQADRAMLAMLAHLRDRRRSTGHHLLAIEWMHAGGPVAESLHRAASALRLPVATGEHFERSAILRPVGDDPGDSVEPLRRQRTTRKKLEKLIAHAGPVKVVDRADDPTVLDEIIALEARGYKGREGIALDNWPGEAEWFKEMVGAFARDGRAVVTTLEAADRAIAAIVVVTGGDDVFFCLTTYDEEFSHYAPGIQVRYDTVDLLTRTRRFRRADTCTYADNAVRQEIFPDHIAVATVLVGLGSPVERVLLASLPTARRLRARLRSRSR